MYKISAMLTRVLNRNLNFTKNKKCKPCYVWCILSMISKLPLGMTLGLGWMGHTKMLKIEPISLPGLNFTPDVGYWIYDFFFTNQRESEHPLKKPLKLSTILFGVAFSHPSQKLVWLMIMNLLIKSPSMTYQVLFSNGFI